MTGYDITILLKPVVVNFATTGLYQSYYDNLLTSLIFRQASYKLPTSCFELVDILGQAVQTQLVDDLSTDVIQDVRFLRVYCGLPTEHVSQTVAVRDGLRKLSTVSG